MVKVCHSFILFSAAHALDDAEAMLQVGKFEAHSDSQSGRVQQAIQMESNFEKLAAEAVRTGETPSFTTEARSAVNSALDTLEAELKKEKIANDAEMVGANAQCAACNTAQKDAFTKKGAGVNAFASRVEKARSKHASCRATEDPNCGDEKKTCVDQDQYAEMAHSAGPQCPCKDYDTADAMKGCLQKALDWGNKFNTELGDKIKACGRAKKVAKNIAKKCDKDQTKFEMAFCSYEVLITTTCEAHSTCYESAVQNRGVVMSNTKTKEASEKIMWKSCKKVRCYLDMLNATQISQGGFDKCKKQEADVKHLAVTYDPAPAKVDCDSSPVKTVPGDADWLKAEYAKLAPKKSWLPKRKGIEKVSPCPKLEPQIVKPIVKPIAQPVVKPIPEPIVTSRCRWSGMHKDKYIGGCSQKCARFKELAQAKVACAAEKTCGGVTLEHGKWELRSGPRLAQTPKGKGENSYVCDSQPWHPR